MMSTVLGMLTMMPMVFGFGGYVSVSRGDEKSRRNHPGERAVRVMTIHPVRRKARGQQPSASDEHTGTTKARPPEVVDDRLRTNDEKQPLRYSRSPGRGSRACVLESKEDPPHAMEYQTELP